MRAISSSYRARPPWNNLLTDFDSFFKTSSIVSPFSLHCDVEETEEAIVLTADVPGVSKTDLNIEIDESVLTLSGTRKSSTEALTTRDNLYRERRMGEFSRSFRIPDVVKVEGIRAEHSDGVLIIEMPKKDKVLPKKIEIQARSSKS